MASMPTTFLRSLVAWKRPRHRFPADCESPRRFQYFQELLNKKDSESSGSSRTKIVPDLDNQVCQMTENPFRILKMAAKGDTVEIERLCLLDPSRVHLRDAKGWTAIHHASANNQSLSVIILSNHGADLSSQDNLSQTALHIAVQRESLDVIDTLIQFGCDTRLVDNDGNSPLHLTIITNKIKPLEAILHHLDKIDILQGDVQGRTALHLAAKCDYADVAMCLLNAYEKLKHCPNQPCLNGYSPIHIAARNASVGVLEALLSWGDARGCLRKRMICLPDLEGNVPLHLAVHGGEIKAVKLCLMNGAMISAQQDDKSTPVHLACSQGSLDIVKLMFAIQPEEKLKALETFDAQGMNPLHCAAMFDHPELVSYLLEEGAMVDHLDKENRSALLLAAAHGGWRTVDILLKYGANPAVRDSNSKNLLHIVIMNGGSVTDVLSLTHAKDSEWTSRLRFMLNEQDSKGWSPLHYASRSGKISSLASLLSLGASVRTKDIRNENPLHFAAKYGRYNTVRQLIESINGFLILNECNDEGKTALHIASEEGHTKVVQLLLGKGALLHKDHFGRTPLHLAASGGHSSTVTALLGVHSHILDQTDKDGNTPMHLAVRANKPEIVSQLMSLNCQLLPNNHDCLPIDCALIYKIVQCALALVTHERGPSEVINISSKIHGCICMALVRTLPKVFEAVLHQAIERANVKEQSKDFSIKYSFYPLQLSDEQLQAERIKKKDPTFKPPPLYACNEMVNCGRLELLMHPLTQRYLEMKWQAYGKCIHLCNLFMYLLFLSLVTIFAVGVLGHKCSITSMNQTFIYSSEIFSENDSEGPERIKEPTAWMYFMAIAIIMFAIFNMAKELFQIYHHRLKYLLAAINAVEWTMYLTSICMVMPVFMGNEWKAHQFNSASLAVFTAWFSLLLYFQRFDRIGIFIVMFLEILNTLLKVLVVFSVLIVAFGLGFYILMSHGGYLSFSSVPMSMLHTFSMMLGEMDFLTLFVYPYFDESPRGDVLQFPRTTFVLLILFMILMPILLMNLLIGLAVGDIESVKKNAQLKRIAMQVEMHTDLENKMPDFIMRRVNKSEMIIYPNRLRGPHVLHRFLSALSFACPMKDKGTSDLETLEPQGEDVLWEELMGQQRQLQQISSALEKQTKLLQLIMQKMEIKSEANESDEGVSEEELKIPVFVRRLGTLSATSRKTLVLKKD